MARTYLDRPPPSFFFGGLVENGRVVQVAKLF
jgi:hypothetical protein